MLGPGPANRPARVEELSHETLLSPVGRQTVGGGGKPFDRRRHCGDQRAQVLGPLSPDRIGAERSSCPEPRFTQALRVAPSTCPPADSVFEGISCRSRLLPPSEHDCTTLPNKRRG